MFSRVVKYLLRSQVTHPRVKWRAQQETLLSQIRILMTHLEILQVVQVVRFLYQRVDEG